MSTPIFCHIKIEETLDDQWAEWFSPLVIHSEPNGHTTLSGPLRDQSELHGMLIKVRDLNLTLLAVTSNGDKI
jgi:hypothetical protein